jgi:hypothetical protein
MFSRSPANSEADALSGAIGVSSARKGVGEHGQGAQPTGIRNNQSDQSPVWGECGQRGFTIGGRGR